MPDGEHEKEQDHFLSNGVYNVLKYIAQIVLPAFGTLYFALSQIWGLPNGENVVGTIVALDAFIGVVLGYSTYSYNNSEAKYDGSIEVEELGAGNKAYSLVLNSDPEDIDDMKQVVFKVNSSTPEN